MGKISQSSKFDEVQGGWDGAKRWVATFCGDVQNQVNGNLEFIENIKCQILDCSFPLANSTYRFAHTLGKIPTGWIAVSLDRAAIIYKDSGAGDNSGDQIKLQSSVAGLVAKVMIF